MPSSGQCHTCGDVWTCVLITRHVCHIGISNALSNTIHPGIHSPFHLLSESSGPLTLAYNTIGNIRRVDVKTAPSLMDGAVACVKCIDGAVAGVNDSDPMSITP